MQNAIKKRRVRIARLIIENRAVFKSVLTRNFKIIGKSTSVYIFTGAQFLVIREIRLVIAV